MVISEYALYIRGAYFFVKISISLSLFDEKRMISQERAIEGLTEYFEKEIIAKMGGLRQWGLDAVKQDLVETYVCKHLDALDYIKCRDENGINTEKLISQLIVSAKKFGPAVEHFPIVGNITFTERDLISLARYLGLPDY